MNRVALGPSGLVLLSALSVSSPAASGPLSGIEILVVGATNGKSVVVARSDENGRFGVRVRLPEGQFFVVLACGGDACSPALMSRVMVNGTSIPRAQGLQIDTRTSPELRTLSLSGRVEEDLSPGAQPILKFDDAYHDYKHFPSLHYMKVEVDRSERSGSSGSDSSGGGTGSAMGPGN